MKHTLGCNVWGTSPEDKMDTIQTLAAAGFDTVMLMLEPKEKEDLKKLITLTRDLGMTVDELHSPFSQINNMWYDEPYFADIVELYKECIDICAELGVDTMVLHDSSQRVAPDLNQTGLNRFREIFLYAREKKVRIAMENIRHTNYTARILFENRDLPVYYCWDSGHEQCYTAGVEHLLLFPDKLVCTHIHDNCGLYTFDDHLLPFDGVCDWEKKASLIKASGYTGALTLELNEHRPEYAHMSKAEYIQEAYNRIQQFAEMCE